MRGSRSCQPRLACQLRLARPRQSGLESIEEVHLAARIGKGEKIEREFSVPFEEQEVRCALNFHEDLFRRPEVGVQRRRLLRESRVMLPDNQQDRHFHLLCRGSIPSHVDLATDGDSVQRAWRRAPRGSTRIGVCTQ